MTVRLNTLVINDFRSLRGEVVVPLDAQVVLVHGANGLGKTSVLSAIELGLTGRIAHLEDAGKTYQDYLANLAAGEGSIRLTTTAPLEDGGAVEGEVKFGEIFAATPLLAEDDALVFSNRCYLPQAALGRLLELYDDQTTTSESRLTRFVNELLGLDPLDALVDGLEPAFHVSRIRNLVPEYREVEDSAGALNKEVSHLDERLAQGRQTHDERRQQLATVLAELDPSLIIPAELETLDDQLTASSELEAQLTAASALRAELSRVVSNWSARQAGDPAEILAAHEQASEVAARALDAWRSGPGEELDTIGASLEPYVPDLPSFGSSPVEARRTALDRAQGELTRRQALVDNANRAKETLETVKATVQRSSARIVEIDRDVSVAVSDAKSLANALAAISPHVHGETCPVCERDFAEVDPSMPLSTFIAGRIAALTTEAGRLQALATERASETARLTQAQQHQLSAERAVLDQAVLTEYTLSLPRLRTAIAALIGFEAQAAAGATAIQTLSDARTRLQQARRLEEQSSSALSDAAGIVAAITGRELATFSSVEEAFERAAEKLDAETAAAERAIANRAAARSLVSLMISDLGNIARLQSQRDESRLLANERAEALDTVGDLRKAAKAVSEAADVVRSDLVKSVFNTSLNRLWSDLFVRLAPSEDFVPTFNLVSNAKGKAEAQLETRHRSGVGSGTPGAMLSQGNLNTAALTLFLALHLSAPSSQPWLILDDPVQSMDDVHIAQFAALLRTLSKKLDKQVIIAVHERALFDYLALELSPAFPDDSLLTVEITRTSDGLAVATPVPYSYEPDSALAA